MRMFFQDSRISTTSCLTLTLSEISFQNLRDTFCVMVKNAETNRLKKYLNQKL